MPVLVRAVGSLSVIVIMVLRRVHVVHGAVVVSRVMRTLVRVTMLMRMGVAVRMRMHEIAMPVLVGMRVAVGVAVPMLVWMGARRIVPVVMLCHALILKLLDVSLAQRRPGGSAPTIGHRLRLAYARAADGVLRRGAAVDRGATFPT